MTWVDLASNQHLPRDSELRCRRDFIRAGMHRKDAVKRCRQFLA